MKTIGIPRALLYYYYHNLWKYFFEYLKVKVIYSDISNKKILNDGVMLANSEACLSLKLYLGHVKNLIGRCDYILVPRLYSVKKNESVCTNFNCLYDLVNNTFDDLNILNYNVDLCKGEHELLGFLNMGRELGFSYIHSYNAYKHAKNKSLEIRKSQEKNQELKLKSDKIKVLIASHPYNIQDHLIGKDIIDFLTNNHIEILYSNYIPKELVDVECNKLSTDINWTHNKEIMASIHYYHSLVDGIILISSFPCGPDSLSNELVIRKVKNVPILTLVIDELNSSVGMITRLESFFDILHTKKGDRYAKDH